MGRVVIAGATGLVGSHVLGLLLATPSCEGVVSLVRNPTGVTHPKLTEKIVNFARLSHTTIDSPVDAIVCCLGTTIKKAGSQQAFHQVDFGLVLALAQWGRQHQARHFLVVSSMGANSGSRVFYSRTKGEMEEAVSALGYPTVDIFRPSLLLGTRREARSGEKFGEAVLGILNPFLIGPLRNYRAIDAKTVARAIVRRAENAKPGHHIHLSGTLQES